MTDSDRGRSTAENLELDKLKADMADLRSAFAKLLEDAKRGATRGVGKEAERLYGKLADSSERSASALAHEVEARPLTSLLVAFAIGFVGGRLLLR